jgi:hypothetical protein
MKGRQFHPLFQSLKLSDNQIQLMLLTEQKGRLTPFTENGLENENENYATDAEHQENFGGYLIYCMHVKAGFSSAI